MLVNSEYKKIIQMHRDLKWTHQNYNWTKLFATRNFVSTDICWSITFIKLVAPKGAVDVNLKFSAAQKKSVGKKTVLRRVGPLWPTPLGDVDAGLSYLIKFLWVQRTQC